MKDQNWGVALFNEMASTPATLGASRYVDLYSCFPGHDVQGRDVEQAYLQADHEGTPTCSATRGTLDTRNSPTQSLIWP